eukprot:2452153-Rhodomonas_salina.2
MHGKGQQQTLARNEHCTDSFGLQACSLVSPSKTCYLPPVPAQLTGYTWVRGPARDSESLPVLGMAVAVSTEGDGPASNPLA